MGLELAAVEGGSVDGQWTEFDFFFHCVQRELVPPLIIFSIFS